jgi:hypothetical protein
MIASAAALDRLDEFAQLLRQSRHGGGQFIEQRRSGNEIFRFRVPFHFLGQRDHAGDVKNRR